MFYILILFFVTLWQKTRSVRSLFQFSQCRFYPSCSDYFLESIKVHGLILGIMFSLKRFLRCSPLCEGGVDEVSAYSVERLAYRRTKRKDLFTVFLNAIRYPLNAKGSYGH